MLKGENAFTLIEMLIVLSIITVLIILIVPTLTNKTGEIQTTGCNALVQTVQGQVAAYELERSKSPSTIDELESYGFITSDQKECQNGKKLVLSNDNGRIKVEASGGN